MSLLNQRSQFSAGSRFLILETDPRTMSAVETIAIVLGAKEDEYNHHNFVFNSNSTRKNNQSLDALEMVYEKIPESYITKIRIQYRNQDLVIEGDDGNFKALVALLQVFGKDISSNVITFSDDEKYSFFAAYNVAERLGILPA